MNTLVTANTKTMSILGAQTMVLGKFFDAALTRLTTVQRSEVSKLFRGGIEDAMCLMDDLALPADYHSTLLQFTNAILVALGQQSATGE